MSEISRYTPESMAVSGGFTLLPSDSLPASCNLSLSASKDNQSYQNSSKQVTFLNMQEVFPIDEDLVCAFSYNDDVALEEEGEHYVAICIHGEISKSFDVIASVSVSRECYFQGEQKIYTVIFPANKIPSESKLYQFCYISLNNVIGVSSPFSFGALTESDYIAVEDPNDPGLVVFKSRVSQLNEEIVKLKEEKGDLTTKCQLNEESVALLRKELDKLEAALNHIHSHNRTLMETNKSLQLELQDYQHKTLPQMFEQMTLTPLPSSDFQKISHSINEVKELVSDLKRSAAVKEDLNNIHEVVESISNTLKNNSLCSCSIRSELQDLEQLYCPSSIEQSGSLNESSGLSNESLERRTLTADSEKDDVQACLSNVIKYNNALSNELQEVKETNAFLKSRVSVLELEVCSKNDSRYQLHMDCICAYEHENSCLKAEIEKFKKDECEIQSLKNQIALLTRENLILRSHVRSSTAMRSPQEDKRLQELQVELIVALNEKQILKTQLMDLRKETVGKISLHQSIRPKTNDDCNGYPCDQEVDSS